ncbi:MAG: UPF0182 family protein, partial [Bacillota bacterium]|nr:UPF0182 family protein [Bacillota bacterium]
ESEKAANEPSYAAMKLTGSDTEETVLLQYFNMKSKLNMVALFGARMDNDNYGKMILYRFPADNLADSPLLFKRKANQDPNISKEISLWNGNGSQLVYGDTMIIPIKNSLLYIEPVYLRATGENSVPEMKRVIVSYSDKIIMANNIDDALNQLFGIDNTEGQSDTTETQTQTPELSPTPTPSGTNQSSNNPSDVKAKIKQAKDLYDKAIEAQQKGDWATYGDYLKQMSSILDELSK